MKMLLMARLMKQDGDLDDDDYDNDDDEYHDEFDDADYDGDAGYKVVMMRLMITVMSWDDDLDMGLDDDDAAAADDQQDHDDDGLRTRSYMGAHTQV